MSRFARFAYLFCWLLFITGCVLVIIENGSELSFWIVSFGIVIDLVLLTLPIFDAPILKLPLGKGDSGMGWAMALHLVGIILAIVAIPVRFLSFFLAFQIIMIFSIITWTASLILFLKHPKKRMETST